MRRIARLRTASALLRPRAPVPSTVSPSRQAAAQPTVCLRRTLCTTRPLHSSNETQTDIQAQQDAAAAVAAPELSIPLPPDVVKVPRPDEITDSSYVPADTADGLLEVGGTADYWDVEGRWNPALEIRGFGPPAGGGKIADPAVLEVCARRAVLEALAMRQEGSSVGLAGLWERGGAAQRTGALGLEVEVGEDGAASLRGDVAGVAKGLAWDPEAPEVEADAGIEAAEAQELLRSWDASWKRVSIEDPALKFAITKRIQQLTGHILPDAKLSSAPTAGALLGVLAAPPKPKKLAELIAAAGELPALPNVTVHARRVTPIDKEKAVGRWKVIVQELEKRELPVTGTAGYGRPLEKRWATGQV